jgi:hypothetical protein
MLLLNQAVDSAHFLSLLLSKHLRGWIRETPGNDVKRAGSAVALPLFCLRKVVPEILSIHVDMVHAVFQVEASYLAASPPVPGIFDPPNRKAIPLRSPSLCGKISILAKSDPPCNISRSDRQ